MILDFLRGIRMLRHRDLVRRLGEIWSAEREIEDIRRRNPGAHISSDAKFLGWRKGQLSLALGSRIEFGTIIALGDEHNGYGTLAVGRGTWIGPYNNLRISGGTSVRIGEGCLVSQFCSIVSANHSIARSQRIAEAKGATDRVDVTIGDDVWIGAGAVILPGVTLSNGAVIGAGSIVNRSVGEYEIWAGNPAARVGERRD
jgi:acetyltransferase-like isoleucine patch superfamily enzyme